MQDFVFAMRFWCEIVCIETALATAGSRAMGLFHVEPIVSHSSSKIKKINRKPESKVLPGVGIRRSSARDEPFSSTFLQPS